MVEYKYQNNQQYPDIDIEEDLVVYSDKDFKSRIICQLCQNLLKRPIMVCSGCNYYACGVCINRALQQQPGKCPLKCKSVVKFEHKPVPLLQDLLDKVQIKCPNSKNKEQSQQCQQILNYNNYQKHFAQCKFTYYSCKYKNCKFIGLKSEVMVHENDECPLKPIKCQFCLQEFILQTFIQNKHKETCEYRMIECLNNGCNLSLQATIFKKHQEECQFAQGACQFCEAKFIKKDIENHLQECNLIIINCQYCKNPFKKQFLLSHMPNCDQKPITCQCGFSDFRQSFQKNHSAPDDCIVYLKQQQNLSDQSISNLSEEFVLLKQEVFQLKTDLQIILNIGSLKDKIKDQQNKIDKQLSVNKNNNNQDQIIQKAKCLAEVLNGNYEDFIDLVHKNQNKSLDDLFQILLEKSKINV